MNDRVKNCINAFSVLVTERCNLNCSYCHFYTIVSRKSKNDMSDNVFNLYMHFIKKFKENIGGEMNYRFSGGDPIVLGDRLFELTNRGYKITGIKPYILTAGKGINAKWIDKAKRSDISHLFISLENPVAPDPGSTNPFETMKKIKKYHSEDLPLLLGITIVKNKHFKHIYKICKIVYDELGCLPKIQEVNYKPYESPTEEELQDLYENLGLVVSDYYNKAAFDMFSYISPEFNAAHDRKETFLMEFNIYNRYGITENNFEESLEAIWDRQNVNYPKNSCTATECDWFDNCRRIKWLWTADSEKVSKEQKIEDYCRFKKTINNAFYDALKEKIDDQYQKSA